MYENPNSDLQFYYAGLSSLFDELLFPPSLLMKLLALNFCSFYSFSFCLSSYLFNALTEAIRDAKSLLLKSLSLRNKLEMLSSMSSVACLWLYFCSSFFWVSGCLIFMLCDFYFYFSLSSRGNFAPCSFIFSSSAKLD